MTTQKKIGEFPTNARIKISYPEKGEPTINFEYPDNKRQIDGLWASSGVTVLALLATVFTITMLYLFLYSQLVPEDYPNCIVHPISDSQYSTPDIYNTTNNITIYNNLSSVILACGKEDGGWLVTWKANPLTMSKIWSAEQYPAPPSQVFGVIGFAIIILTLYFGGIYLYGKLFARFMLKTKFGQKHYPGFNKVIHDKHYQAEFKECPDNLKIELPLFSNIYMDYEAEEEFADYLTNVDILEHDVKYVKTKRLFGILRSKKKEYVPNVYLWKVVFTFKKKPTKGLLKVNFT